jgi:hypothetical protein
MPIVALYDDPMEDPRLRRLRNSLIGSSYGAIAIGIWSIVIRNGQTAREPVAYRTPIGSRALFWGEPVRSGGVGVEDSDESGVRFAL